MKHLISICLLIVLSIAATANVGLGQSIGRQSSYSAAFLRDICTGQRAGINPKEQDKLCRFYLSSFHDAIDEYGEAGVKLFCPAGAMSVETMRGILIGYIADLPESADFLPGGRVLVQALARAYPCNNGQ